MSGCELVRAHNERTFIVTICLVAIKILSLATVSRVMEEKRVVRLSAVDQPPHGRDLKER